MPEKTITAKVDFTTGDQVEIFRDDCPKPQWQRAIVVGSIIEVLDERGAYAIMYVCQRELDLQKLNGSNRPGVAHYHVKPKNIRAYEPTDPNS